jgi:hypothetical protein
MFNRVYILTPNSPFFDAETLAIKAGFILLKVYGIKPKVIFK